MNDESGALGGRAGCLNRCLVREHRPPARPLKRRIIRLRRFLQRVPIKQLARRRGKLFQQIIFFRDARTVFHRGRVGHGRSRGQRVGSSLGHVGHKNGNLVRGKRRFRQPSALHRRKMFPHRIDFGNWRARMHQRAISRDEVIERNLVVDWLLDNRRSTAAQQENDERRRRLRLERPQHGARRLDRLRVGRRVPSAKIAEAVNLRCGLNGTGHDPFERRSHLFRQRFHHRVSGLAQRRHEHARIRVQVEQIFAHAQHSAIAVHMPGKRPRNRGLGQGRTEDPARTLAHVSKAGVVLGVGHGWDYKSFELSALSCQLSALSHKSAGTDSEPTR